MIFYQVKKFGVSVIFWKRWNVFCFWVGASQFGVPIKTLDIVGCLQITKWLLSAMLFFYITRSGPWEGSPPLACRAGKEMVISQTFEKKYVEQFGDVRFCFCYLYFENNFDMRFGNLELSDLKLGTQLLLPFRAGSGEVCSHGTCCASTCSMFRGQSQWRPITGLFLLSMVLFLIRWKQREKLEDYLEFCAGKLMSHRFLRNSWTPVQIMWLSVLLPMGTALELSQEWMEFLWGFPALDFFHVEKFGKLSLRTLM